MQYQVRAMSWLLVCCVVLALMVTPALGRTSFIAFESGQVRPIAMSPDGSRLFATNTPDNRLEIFVITETGIRPQTSLPVGMEPVAVAARSNDEVWVVNHVSDSVSIVDVGAEPPRVVRTLLVGDEPRDIVFAGPNGNRAFITTAHRGQHRTHPSIADVPGAGDPRLTTAGVPRADVWVYDATTLNNTLGGRPIKILELFGDTPRALAVSPDGQTVYAAVFNSGNQTTVVGSGAVCPDFSPNSCVIEGVEYPGGNPGPATNHAGDQAPKVGIIVKYNAATGAFEDELGRNWNDAVRFDLPDQDVFAIDATSLQEVQAFAHVGTTLFNMVTNPRTGVLYVSNLESINQVRFEGPGQFADSTVQGHLAETRITVISGATVRPRHLNKHIDYDILPSPPSTKAHSLATPLDMVVSGDGTTLYVAAFGSRKVGVFNTSALESNTFDPTLESRNYITLSAGGPSGLVLDEARGRLYVLTRFDNAIAVVNLASGLETAHVALYNPEPPSVVAGRPFLYDAFNTSSNGEASCSSCHIFGDLDHLAWDLGDPDGDVTQNPIPIKLDFGAEVPAELEFTEFDPDVTPINGTGEVATFHPMKGPMTTQTLRGMVNHGAMHWRGDRATGFFGTDKGGTPTFDADLSFRNFIVAFEGLNGRETILSKADMQTFSDFALQITLPPNPVRNLNNDLTQAQRRGRKFFIGCDGPGDFLCVNERPLFGQGHRAAGLPLVPDAGFSCNGCHSLEPEKGFFGTDGQASFEGVPQIVKIPHLRNIYHKVGMFGNPAVREINRGNNNHQGDQVRGFGFLHDGSIDTVFRFLNGKVFNANVVDLVGFNGGDSQRRDAEQFVLAFDNDLAPIVGQQVTRTQGTDQAVDERIRLFIERSHRGFDSKLLGPDARECDLVVKGTIEGETRGWLYIPQNARFRSDRVREPELSRDQLFDLTSTPGQPLTFTCAPFGSGVRMALDRDEDGHYDRDERDAGRDPADATSHP